jgi:hypothetical protein
MFVSSELKLNYYALIVAILAPATPELAFMLLEAESSKNLRWFRLDITPDDEIDMIKLKKELTYKEVGEIYCMKDHAVYNRIRRMDGRLPGRKQA